MISLRDVRKEDLPYFFEYNKEPEAVHMAAFTTRDPADRDAFNIHWEKIMSAPTVLIKTILVANDVAGSVLSFIMDDKLEVSYWIGKKFWGRGIATEALKLFLEVQTVRPVYARVAVNNIASFGVLQKNDFKILSREVGYANARGEKIEEYEMIREN